jgi:serine/threonine protein kinase
MQLGQQIGPFLIEKELGHGAMGTVYRARHAETGQRVAIKVMAPGLNNDLALARFKREAAILKELKHPNIVRLIASGKFQGSPFYAMEYIEGESLDHVMARRGRISWEEVVALGKQLAAALQHAHEHAIIHRDLKPSNLMVLAGGTIKLTDFGIAKDLDVTALTAANSTVGTAAYMSPEQCRGERELTGKSDLYSMGVMFYELLTGKRPFEAESAMEMFMLHNQGTFERPSRLVLDIPIWLDTLVCQLMEKKPEQRPFNAEAVGKALEQIEERVTAQKSAGIEAAKARRIDRTGLEPGMDRIDKEAARTLLKKKKKKKGAIPFYRRTWFRAVVLGSGLVGVVLALMLFLQPPSAESLLQRTQDLLKQGSPKDARQSMREFLQLYPHHAEAAKVRQWADNLDLERREAQMHNRRNAGMDADSKGEELAQQALRDEDLGKLEEARAGWLELKKHKDKDDEDERAWGLVAEKYYKELLAVDDLAGLLRMRIERELKTTGTFTREERGATKEEDLAVKATRDEMLGRKDAAKMNWQELKQAVAEERSRPLSSEEDRMKRRWYLLAAGKLRKLEASQ